MQQHVVGDSVLLADVVAVVGSHQRDVQLLCKHRHPFQHRLVDGNSVILNLQVEILAEKLAVPDGRLACGIHVLVHQMGGHHTAGAGRKADQPFMVFLQQLPVDSRFVVEAFGVGAAGKPVQRTVAVVVFCQKNQMEVISAALFAVRFQRGLVEAVAVGNVHLAAHNRFYPRFFGFLIELQKPEIDAVIGKPHGRHVVLTGCLNQSVDAACAIEQ